MMFRRYLLERGVCSVAQIDQAARSQVVFGGRIGTNLVEMGHLRAEQLEQLLADYYEVDAAPTPWLANADRALRDVIPKPLIARYQVLPLAIDGMTLHLAMLDPRDEALVEELQFVSGCDVVPYALSEIQMQVLLAHHYDIPCDPRFPNLAAPIARLERPGREESAQELIDEETFNAMHGDWQGGAPGQALPETTADALAHECVDALLEPESETPKPDSAPAARGQSALELEAALADARDRDAIADATLALALGHADAVALFVVRSGLVTGFRGDGIALPREIEGVMLPVEVECAFARAAREAAVFRGALVEDLDRRVTAALGRPQAAEVLILPVQIQNRVVNLLYADAGARSLAETSVAALGAVAGLASRSYGELILRVKTLQESGAH